MLHDYRYVPFHLLFPSVFEYGYQNAKIVNFRVPRPLRVLSNAVRKQIGEVK